MRADVIAEVWKQIEPTAYITAEQFARGLAQWEIEAVEIDGCLAFATFTRGAEFHFTSFDTGASITMGMIRSRLDPILEKHGRVITRTPIGDARQHRVNRAFGFKAVGEDEFFIHYELRRKCQS